MNTDNIAKWVDELQAQIDDVKRTGGDDAAIKARVTALETSVSNIESLPFTILLTKSVTLEADANEIEVTFDALPYKAADYDIDASLSFDATASSGANFSMAEAHGSTGSVSSATVGVGGVTAGTGSVVVITNVMQATSSDTTLTTTLSAEDGDDVGFMNGYTIKVYATFIIKKKPATRSRKKGGK